MSNTSDSPEKASSNFIIILFLIIAFISLLFLIMRSCSASNPSEHFDASRCQPASQAQIKAIELGVQDIASYNHVYLARAVKSRDFNNVWMVAAALEGPGLEPKKTIGVWAMGGSPDEPGPVFAVNGFAKTFSIYPDASKTAAGVTLSDDGVKEAIECVKRSLP